MGWRGSSTGWFTFGEGCKFNRSWRKLYSPAWVPSLLQVCRVLDYWIQILAGHSCQFWLLCRLGWKLVYSIITFILGLWPFHQFLLFPPCTCCVQVLEGDVKPVFLFCAAEEPLRDKPVALRHLSVPGVKLWNLPQPLSLSTASSQPCSEKAALSFRRQMLTWSRKGLVAKALVAS